MGALLCVNSSKTQLRRLTYILPPQIRFRPRSEICAGSRVSENHRQNLSERHPSWIPTNTASLCLCRTLNSSCPSQAFTKILFSFSSPVFQNKLLRVFVSDVHLWRRPWNHLPLTCHSLCHFGCFMCSTIMLREDEFDVSPEGLRSVWPLSAPAH